MTTMKARYPLDSKQEATQTFERLCEQLPEPDVVKLGTDVEAALVRLRETKDEFIGPNLELAEALAMRCHTLISHYPGVPEGQKALIVGAIRYFLESEDQLPDDTPIVGFDDDINVMNHVLERLGLYDKFISA